MKYLTRDEIQRLLVCVDNKRDKLLIQLGFALGCRVSEIVGIRCKNIYSDHAKLWDEKKDTFREVVIDSGTMGLLNDHLATEWKARPYSTHKLFYFSTKTANRILKKWCKIAGISDEKSHWHALRHTYVVQSLECGVPLSHVVEQTGDSPSTVIKVYGRPSIDARREMLERKAYWRS